MVTASKKTGFRKLIFVLAGMLALLLVAPTASADVNWTDASGNWSEASNWSSDPDLPGPSDDVQISNTTASAWTITFDVDSSVNSLTLDATPGGSTATLSQTGNYTLQAEYETIGDGGSGAYDQSNGLNTINSEFSELILGAGFTGHGNYTLSGVGTLSVYDEFVGYAGIGVFTQTGGTHTVSNSLVLADGGGSGSYTLQGGSLSAATVTINNPSTFTQTGGTFDFAAANQNGSTGSFTQLVLGRDSGSTSTYDLSGGSLTVVDEIIGGSGVGVFTQSSGTHTVTGTSTLILGDSDGSSGTYTLNAPGSLSTFSEIIGNAGSGTFTQNSGTHTVNSNLLLGYSSNGTYYLSGGSLSAGGELVGIDGIGAFTQSGGTNTANDLHLAYDSPGTGTYDLSGSGSLSAGVEYVGEYGTGAFTQSGGTNTISTDLYLGYFFNSGSGTYTQTGGHNTVGGTLYLGVLSNTNGSYDLSGSGSLSAVNEYIGLGGTGVFTHSAGYNTVSGSLTLGEGAISSGTYTLSNTGSLSTSYEIVGNSGIGTFTQSDGTNIVTNTLTLAANSGSSGTYNLTGGSLSAGTIQINGHGIGGDGTFNVTGGTQTVTGSVTNEGLVKTTNTDVTWNGTFTNNGVYMSDPATQTFSDLTVGTTGHLEADAGDLFKVSGNFDNQSTQNTDWDTAAATLQFTGTGGTDHNLSITGTDYGPNGPGYTDNFSWATLKIDDQTVHLLGDGDGALYVKVITGVDVVSHAGFAYNIYGTMSETLNIYYDPTQFDNIYLDGLTYAFESGNGQLIPTPLPASVLLLGSGLLGLGLIGRRRKSSK